MRRLKLHHWILISMALGAAVGLPMNWLGERGDLDPELVRSIAAGGKELGGIFLRLLQMLVVPLIVSSLISGVTGMGDLRALGRLGGRTIVFYLSTSALAILTGVLLVNLLNPGAGADLGLLEAGAGAHAAPEVAASDHGLGAMLWEQLTSMIPKNPLQAAAEGDMLGIIFFSIVLGVFISFVEHGKEAEGEEGEGPYRESDAPRDDEDARHRKNAALVRRFWEGFFEVMMRMTLAVIQLAPIGVFGFMLYAAAGHGLSAFEALGMYALTVFIALCVHAFVTLPLILRVFGGHSPLAHAKAMTPALLTAFSTASSNGTLPLTMRCVEESGVPSRVGSFVLPLGATINMDGTALYEVVAVLFIAQVYGMDLDLSQQLVVATTALLASVGAAGIPHAGTVMMVVVLSAVGLPTTAVGLILAVDRILDMCRTTVNVWSDSAAAVVVARHAGELPAEGPADPE
ncbi:MAG TPA: dicarboxylate/amino acid:cation symporter [Polyangiaceae bacterium LLY-WYZ-15_(1-7)]|nr:dicarboxylate/amino acid:cation symporter [Sandaracinus sp.]MBJ72143.1 dicarboxylate/amino acid:cation symporter [Sandaracinus sp.]HJL01354.1 dicarboxylate/amino acid:cation symporter [Polyangiaceae bacterium LLY-WYZ-15_(1-7)]HJL09508.1 dicarboxylate/amino acid:cation symporter [Polyangiaceae bacterium LLY-WYZ-15_(1-7)]HJL23450.1 dicarboxylate/amino acid:cation symporter [Polyangiaceae bacterium LLY-WYZ-15_(1-7)]